MTADAPGHSGLPPGRDLDCLVAEGVFGFHRRTVGLDYDGKNQGEVLVPPEGLPPGYHHPPRGTIPLSFHVPEYSRDVTRAMRVIDAMTARGWGCKLATWISMDEPDFPQATRGVWVVAFCKQMLPLLRVSREAVGMPHAVCLAAVAAVLEEQRPSRPVTPR